MRPRPRAVSGVRQVVRIEGAVAVVADHTWAAKKGLKAAAVEWDDGPNAAVGSGDILRQLQEQSMRPGAVARNQGDAQKALAGRSATLRCGLSAAVSRSLPRWSR